MIEGQSARKNCLARFEMKKGVVVRKQAIGGGAEGGILESEGGVGGVTPGRVGTGVLIGRQSSRRGESGSRRQGTSQVQLCGGGVCTCVETYNINKGQSQKGQNINQICTHKSKTSKKNQKL